MPNDLHIFTLLPRLSVLFSKKEPKSLAVSVAFRLTKLQKSKRKKLATKTRPLLYLFSVTKYAYVRRDGEMTDLPSLILPNLSAKDVEWLKEINPKGRQFEILSEGWLF